MKRILLFGACFMTSALCAETLYFTGDNYYTNGTTKYYQWSKVANWKTASGMNKVPAEDDDLVIDTNISGYHAADCSSYVKSVRFTSDMSAYYGFSHAGLSIKSGGAGLVVENSTSKTAYSTLRLDGEVTVKLAGDQYWQGGVEGRTAERKSRVVKLGAGTLKFQKVNGNWSGATIREGGLQITETQNMPGISLFFDGYANSAKFYMASNIVLDAGCLSSTTDLPRTNHGVYDSGKKWTLYLIGDIPTDDVYFAGGFFNTSSFVFNPSSEDCTFTAARAESPTTGNIEVSNGTFVLKDGASFPNLGKLTIGNGAEFKVAADAGVLNVKRVEVGSDATVNMDSGAFAEFETLVVNGKLALDERAVLLATSATGPDGALADGIYTAATTNLITGTGRLIVGSTEVSEATWTGNGGSSTVVSDARNWGEASATELPDLESGLVKARFASGGAVASLGAADILRFSGMTLSREGGFTFEAANGAEAVSLSEQGLTCTAGTTAETYAMGWPLMLRTSQTWSLGGNTLKIDAPLTGSASRLMVTGPGRCEFNRTSYFTGDYHLTNGTFVIAADNFCGASGQTLTLYPETKSKYLFKTGVYDFNVYGANMNNNESYPPIDFDANADVTFNGSFSKSGYVTMKVGKGATVTFRNGVSFANICKWTGDGHVIVTNKPMNVGDRLYMHVNNSFVLDLYAATNKINGNVGDQSYGRINTRVPYALVAVNGTHQRLNIFSSFILDLCGNDQAIGQLGGRGGQIRSDEPAMIHLVSDYAYNETQIANRNTNSTPFVGCAGLSKEGTKVPYFLNGTSSTTGTLQVVDGELTMLAKAFWPNSTNVVVKGGVLNLTHRDTFGKQVVVSISGAGRINLAEGVRQRCAKYVKDGIVQHDGTYGATGSGADYVDDAAFAGKGVLKVGRIGTQIILR